jgi:hypothetical protein
MTKKRKLRFLICRWVIFLLIIVSNTLVAVSDIKTLSFETSEKIYLVGWSYLVLQCLLVLVLMAISLRKFTKVVSKLGGEGNVNRGYISVQISGLIIWTATWIT